MDKELLYPCANPFSQLYLIPREKLQIRFCPFHASLANISNYEHMTYEDLCDFFQNDEKVKEVRQKFIHRDFKGAGCPDGCECMAAYHMGRAGIKMEDYLDQEGKFAFRKANLTMGPDCNIRCRYCLDVDHFKVDFGSCKTEFADFVVPFVHNGGHLLMTGGETFLPKWGFVDKLKQLNAYDENRGDIHVFTNATLLNPESIDVIVKSPITIVGISMDTSDEKMFEYIRRGSKFKTVLHNAELLLQKRNEAHRDDLQVIILCAVLKDTALSLEKTVEFYISRGFTMSLNILFRAYFSPDFCESQSMDLLSLDELQEVKRQLMNVERKWGDKVYTASFSGQLQNVIDKKVHGEAAQLALGGGAPHAPRVQDLKIFVSYHKPGQVIESEALKPIQVGAKNTKQRLPMLHDDDGENISEKNDKYCELTAQYWAWKNCRAEYVGFMHYRRHFVFREISEEPGLDGVVRFPILNEDYKNYIGLNDQDIYEAIHGYDIILPTVVDSAAWGTLSNEVQFSGLDNLHADAFDKACETVVELDPAYKDVVEKYRLGHKTYWYNMFIMRKDIFDQYSEWLFRVLFETEKKLDYTYFSQQEMRTLAFMAERLLSMYVMKLREEHPDIKIKNLKITLLGKTEKQECPLPAKKENNIPIAVACNEYYMPMLGIMLHSLLKRASKKYHYDILVMNCDYPSRTYARQKKMLLNHIKNFKNATLRFIDISALVGTKQFYVTSNFTPETYFRLFLPKLLPHYDKILYLDADMVVMSDISKLYEIDLNGKALGAVRDPIISGSNKSRFFNRHDYMEKLGIKNIYDYFQAGVLLIDLRKIAGNHLCDDMIEYATTHDCELVDQDVLNLFCQGNVHFIDNKWNVDVNSIALDIVPYAPEKMWSEYQYNRDHAYIYHFAGQTKPWADPNLDKADIFWQEARETPWYEIMLEDMANSAVIFKRNVLPKRDEVLDKLAPWPESIANLVIPLVKSYKELAEIGMDTSLEHLVETADDEYQAMVKDKSIIFYGAGNCCRQFLLYSDALNMKYPEEIWDIKAKEGQRFFNVPVVKPDFESLNGVKDTVVFITIENKKVSKSVKKSFNKNGFYDIYENREVMNMMARRLWKKLMHDRKTTE